MTNSSRIIDALKRQLKVRAMTYKRLAECLNLSESAVKHMFSTGNFSLRRLDEICAALEIDIGDLVSLSEAQLPKIEQLSAENEREIVDDDRLLLLTYCLMNHWSFDEIVERYDISPELGTKYLRKLDRMKVIELQPGDRVRLLVASNFSWRKNGAIESFFRKRVQAEFFGHDFQDDTSLRIVKNGMLSRKSQIQLIQKLNAMGDLFDDTNWEDRKLSAGDRNGTTMVLAIRHWFFEGFRHLER
ncbi:MAG: helix-turn-helix transcriptional regulator [Pseudomonadota bacterium]